MKVIKKDIPKYPKYQICSNGKVWSKHSKMYLNEFLNNGYYRVSLHNPNGKKPHKIHRLLAEAFIPNPENKPQINHKNGIKTDNRINNLEWCTPKENIVHASKMGLMEFGEDRYNSKLTKNDVQEIKRRYKKESISQRDLAVIYNVSQRLIWNVLNKQAWKHV